MFCGARGRMTKEHVLPKWMRKEFPALAQERVYQGSHNEHDGPSPSSPRTVYRGGREADGPFSRQAPVVCQPCNNDWMSRLETDVRDPLTRMIRGLPTVLTPDRQATVALWSAKTLMVAYRAPQFGPRPKAEEEVILPADPARLHRDRALGPTMLMALANYQPTEYTREPFFTQTFERMEHDTGQYSYCATLKIGHFVAQLVRLPDGMYPPARLPPPHLTLLQLGGSSVHWPPPTPVRAGAEWKAFARLPERTGT